MALAGRRLFVLNSKEEANGIQTLGVNLESVSLQLGLISRCLASGADRATWK